MSIELGILLIVSLILAARLCTLSDQVTEIRRRIGIHSKSTHEQTVSRIMGLVKYVEGKETVRQAEVIAPKQRNKISA